MKNSLKKPAHALILVSAILATLSIIIYFKENRKTNIQNLSLILTLLFFAVLSIISGTGLLKKRSWAILIGKITGIFLICAFLIETLIIPTGLFFENFLFLTLGIIILRYLWLKAI